MQVYANIMYLLNILALLAGYLYFNLENVDNLALANQNLKTEVKIHNPEIMPL